MHCVVYIYSVKGIYEDWGSRCSIPTARLHTWDSVRCDCLPVFLDHLIRVRLLLLYFLVILTNSILLFVIVCSSFSKDWNKSSQRKKVFDSRVQHKTFFKLSYSRLVHFSHFLTLKLHQDWIIDLVIESTYEISRQWIQCVLFPLYISVRTCKAWCCRLSVYWFRTGITAIVQTIMTIKHFLSLNTLF